MIDEAGILLLNALAKRATGEDWAKWKCWWTWEMKPDHDLFTCYVCGQEFRLPPAGAPAYFAWEHGAEHLRASGLLAFALPCNGDDCVFVPIEPIKFSQRPDGPLTGRSGVAILPPIVPTRFVMR